jgi:hypothetical protein
MERDGDAARVVGPRSADPDGHDGGVDRDRPPSRHSSRCSSPGSTS